MSKSLSNLTLPSMVITIFGNGILFPSLINERRRSISTFNKLTDQSSRITKKNQFIERIAGIVLKRIRGSKEFIPYSLFEDSKARDTGSSQCPLHFPFSERRRSIPTLLTRTIKKYEDYLSYV